MLAALVLVAVLLGGRAAFRCLSVASSNAGDADASATSTRSTALPRTDRHPSPSDLIPLPDPAVARRPRDPHGPLTEWSRNARDRRSSRPIAAVASIDDEATGASSGAASGAASDACSGFGCPAHDCPGGGSTTISGTVYDPAGKRPLYGAVVYVPSTTPAPVAVGASCTTCADLYSGDPSGSAVTDAAGNFTITDAPDGTSIPLLVQIGKWRRQVVLPLVARCTNTSVPDRTLTLPKNGSEGDLPQIAISTGGADSLECLLRRVGVDDSEYVAGAGGSGHVHVFKGNDAGPDSPAPDMASGAPDSSVALWNSMADMMRYDLVLLSCEGYPRAHPNQQVLFDYAAAGGRVFASHSHYAWFDTGPFGASNLAAWTSGTHEGGTSFAASIVTTTWAKEPFARGQAFADWLLNVGALTGNALPIESPPSYNAYVTAANTPSQPWIVANNRTAATLDLSFDTPLGAAPADRCGRVAFADMHVGPAAGDYTHGLGKITPTGCGTNDLAPQEKALELILFDLASCVTPNNAPQDAPN